MAYQPRLDKNMAYDKEGLEAFMRLEEEEMPESYKD